MMNKVEKLLVAGVIIFIVMVVDIVVMEISGCDGTLVRGLFWLECIESK